MQKWMACAWKGQMLYIMVVQINWKFKTNSNFIRYWVKLPYEPSLLYSRVLFECAKIDIMIKDDLKGNELVCIEHKSRFDTLHL